MVKTNLVQRVLCVLLAICVSLSITPITAKATSAERQSAMIEYFQNQGSEGLSNEITEDDLRLFGIFLSNFYIPFETNLTNASDYQKLVQDACAFLMGYDDYLSMTSENKQIVDQLCAKVIGSVTSVVDDEEDKYRLYIVPEGLSIADVSENLENVATVHRWFSNTTSATLQNKEGSVFYRYVSGTNSRQNYCNLSTIVSVLASNNSIVKEYLENDVDTSSYALYITPFGDIVNKQGTVIIPGCVNPYTYSETGSVLPVNNAFAMGSYVSSKTQFESGLTDVGAYVPYYNISSLKNNGTEAPLLMGGIYTGVSLDYVVDVENGEKLRNFIDSIDVCQGSNDFANQYTFIVLSDINLLIDSTNTNEGVKNWWSGASYTAHMTDIAKNIIVPEEQLDELFQDIYIIKTARNGYGSYDYENATRIALFKDKGVSKSDVSSTQLKSSPVYKNYDSKIAGGTLTAKLLFNKSFGDFFANKAACNFSLFNGIVATIEDKTYKDNLAQALKKVDYDLDAYKNAVLQQVYRYQFVEAAADVGSALTQAADYSQGYLPIANQTNFWAEIFYAYMMAYNNLNKNLPPVDLEGLSDFMTSLLGKGSQDIDALAQENQKLANKLMKTSLDLLSGTRNTAKGELISGFLDSWVLDLHRKMLGLNSTNIGTVDNASKRFSGFSSPVTVPGLSELPVTSVILENYRTIYIIALIFTIVASLVLIILQLRTIKQAVATVILMAFCLLLPQTFTDSVTTVTNMFVNTMFSDRFNYWAIIQHQQALQSVTDAGATGDEKDALLAEALVDVTSYYNKSNGVQLRWMAAKKTQTFTELNGTTNVDSTIPGLNVYKFLFSGYLKQESYATEPMATYVYRTYTSLAESAFNNYDVLHAKAGAVGAVTDSRGFPVQASMSANGVYGVKSGNLFYRTVQLSNDGVTEAINNTQVNLSADAGLSIADVDNDDTLAGYLLYSESPFYYFYNVLKTSTMPSDTDGEFLQNFLSDEMYKATTEDRLNGSLRDFLDFEGLFTNVIPYMDAANHYVVQWTDKYGVDGEIAKTYLNGSANVDQVLNKVWNMYCPWVDTLMSSKSSSDRIDVAGSQVLIENTYNASAYKEYRSMVFSEAQQMSMGVSEAALTDVERKLLKVQKQTYEDLRYLANYAQFDDEVLVTAAAMIATFNFNKEFSETAIVGQISELYPQGYELKNFSFDAFLRLILLNNTGISVMSTMDIYEVVLDEEGFFVGILLLIVDMLNIYILPFCMSLFLITVFTLGVLFIVVMIVQTPGGVIKLSWSTIIMPALLYMFVTVAYAGGLAILMGEGLTTYVGSKTTQFITNSPGVTLVGMLILGIIVIYTYVRILIKLINSAVTYGKATVRAICDGAKTLFRGVAGAFGTGAAVAAVATAGNGNRKTSKHRNGFKRNKQMDAAAKEGQREDTDTNKSQDTPATGNANNAPATDSAQSAETTAAEHKANKVADEMNNLSQDNSAVVQSTSTETAVKTETTVKTETGVKTAPVTKSETELATMKDTQLDKNSTSKRASTETQGASVINNNVNNGVVNNGTINILYANTSDDTQSNTRNANNTAVQINASAQTDALTGDVHNSRRYAQMIASNQDANNVKQLATDSFIDVDTNTETD